MTQEIITNQQLKDLWMQVFPNSYASASDGCLGDGQYLKGYIQAKTEWANGISHNDPLGYMGSLYGDVYKDENLGLDIKPNNPYLAYGNAKIRKKTIKNVTTEKLLKRFNEIKQFIIDNKENWYLDLSDKVLTNDQK